MTLDLVEPSVERLPAYAAALEAGWSPNTTRDVSHEQLASIADDPGAFIADLTRTEGGTVTIADGTQRPRLPSRVMWMWDGTFCGAINLRFQPGTLELPAHVSGHVGYSVVPWKRRRGHATRALALMLPIAHGVGLPRVLVTCDEDNEASRRTIEANGGAASGVLDGKRLFWIETGRGAGT